MEEEAKRDWGRGGDQSLRRPAAARRSVHRDLRSRTGFQPGTRGCALQASGIGFVPYSPLGRGFLAGRFGSAPGKLDEHDFRRGGPRFRATRRRRTSASAASSSRNACAARRAGPHASAGGRPTMEEHATAPSLSALPRPVRGIICLLTRKPAAGTRRVQQPGHVRSRAVRQRASRNLREASPSARSQPSSSLSSVRGQSSGTVVVGGSGSGRATGVKGRIRV